MNADVYTGGTFDLFHDGHVFFLGVCREIAGETGRVIVGLNGDDFVARYKDRRPVYSYAERESILRACRHVDNVVLNWGNEDSSLIVDALRPRFVVIGSDWACRDYHRQMGFTNEWLRERDITILYVERGSIRTSSTDVVRRVADRTDPRS